MKFTLSGFSGAIQALHAKLLPEQIGVDSRNQKPGRGDLRPWKQPLTVATVTGGTQTIYRYGRNNAVDNTLWLHFDTNASVVRSYHADTTADLALVCNDSSGSNAGQGLKYFNSDSASHDPPQWFLPGSLAPPGGTPTVTVFAAGTSTQMETLYYVYTWAWNGIESAPSAASAPITCRVDDRLSVGTTESYPTLPSFPVPPAGVTIRWYRTNTGEVGDTDFFFVKEMGPGGPVGFIDDFSVLGEPLETTEWLPPDVTMTNLTVMWNGMLAGLVKGKVRFNVPFVESAWPLRYEISVPDAAAVALGRWEQNLLVLTTAKPLLVTGTTSDSLDQQPLEIGEACIAPRGVVSFGHGVAWPSTDGLVYFGNTGGKMLTAGIFTRDDWQALNPATMVASQYMGAYVCFYLDGSSVRRGFIIDPLNPTGVYFLDTGYAGVWFDELQDKLYVLNGTNVQKWDGDTAFMTATFRSKTVVTPPCTMGALRVDADAYPVTVKVDAGPFTSGQATAIAAASGGLLTSTGTAVRYTATVNDSNPVRLPGGFRASEWVVQVETTQPVQAVAIANNIEELA